MFSLALLTYIFKRSVKLLWDTLVFLFKVAQFFIESVKVLSLSLRSLVVIVLATGVIVDLYWHTLSLQTQLIRK